MKGVVLNPLAAVVVRHCGDDTRDALRLFFSTPLAADTALQLLHRRRLP